MKHNIFAFAAIAALTLTSCQRFVEGPVPAGKSSFTLTVVCSADETKTDLSGEKKVVWNANDQIWLSDGNKSVVVTVPSVYAGSTTADIIVTGLSSDSTIVATYPANDENEIYKDGIVANVPTVQDGSFGAAHVAVAQCAPGQKELAFKNATAILKFSHHIEDIKDVQVRNINLSMCGTHTFDPANGEKLKKMTTSRTLRVKMSGTSDKYIGVVPASMAKNSKFVFVTIDGRLGSIATSTSNSLERNVIYDMGNIDDKIVYYGTATDLGAIETANSYIVPGAGVYKFKTVKGNTLEPVDDIAFAEIIWETVNTTTAPSNMSIVSEIAYSDGYVYFRIPEGAKDGNALVAVYNDKDEIAWSWHLWVLKDGVKDISLADVTTGAGAILMDRNLGALTATKGKITTNGFIYQWGRKDPFTGAASLSSNTLMVAKGVFTPVSKAYTDDNGNIEFAVAEPYSFIFRSSKDWLVSSDATLWSAQSKTAYDPCPPGYHVPFADALSGVAENMKWDATNKGCSVTVNGSELWFPAGGNRLSSSGALSNAGTVGYYWFDKNTTSTGRNAWKFNSAIAGIDTTSTHGLSCGFEMRCQKTATVGDKQIMIIKFTTDNENQYVYSPVINSEGYSDAKVFWSIDFSETLENAKWKQYIYTTPGDYSMTLTGYSIGNVKLKTLEGVKSVDISNF